MLQIIKNRKQGFTLIELAIVLTIAGLLFVGLWRLLAGGNSQIRDQSVANEQQQIASAIKGYLAANPDAWLQNLPAAPGNATLALPTTFAGCVGAQPNLCNFLPSGFISTTPNAYGQTYTIKVVRNDLTTPLPVPTVPSSYSFMIVTTGGDTIPDSSGGRISAAIGNDGGFIYTGLVCTAQTLQTAPNSACGAYGTWSSSTGAYGLLGATASGHVASRTFVSPTADNLAPWLERNLTLPDTNFSLNTMTTNLFMGTAAGGAVTNLYLSAYNPAPSVAPFDAAYTNYLTAGGGNFYMQGGKIEGGGNSNISLTGPAPTPLINLSGGSQTAFAPLNVSNGCTITQISPLASFPAGCNYGISTDNMNVSGLVNANAFYALNFNYTASDIRFKTNVRPIVDALENIMKLKPVTYTFKSTGQENLGIIAQDLEKVYPQLVSKGNGDKYVSYDGLIAPLIGAVQELKQENDGLRQKLHEQEQRQNTLEQEIKALKTSPSP